MNPQKKIKSNEKKKKTRKQLTRYYIEGHQEGQKDGEKAGFIEGRQFGIQTGFQRFLTLGILQGRTEIWKDQVQERADSAVKHERLAKNVDQMKEALCNISMTNNDVDVETLEKTLKYGKVKSKLIISSLKDPYALNLHDDKLDLKPTEETIEQS